MLERPYELIPVWERASELASAFRVGIGDRVQRPLQTYSESLATFEAPTPETGSDGVAIVEELARLAEPGLHAMTGTHFFGWVIGNSHEVGVAADWLTSAWGQNAGNHSATPAAAAAEAISARWLLDILRLPPSASVGFVTGATMANFVCLAAARGEVLRRLGWDVEQLGLYGAPPITIVLGEDAHSTVFSALQYIGFGHASIRKVPADTNGSMLPDAFAQVMEELQTAPAVIVISQAGQINSGAFDPHTAIVESARKHPNCWHHVDGAFGLWARACPDRAFLAEGVDGADSWATDGHKWLQTPYDSGYAIVRDPEAHRRAMTIAASYLPPIEAGERDPSHYVPELSRRARGFPTWAMLRCLGRQGVGEMVDRHCHLSRLMASLLAAEEGITVMNDVVLNQIAVRFGPSEPSELGDDLARKTIAAVQAEGVCFAGGAKWKGHWIMRLSVIGYSISEVSARESAEAIIRGWRAVRG